MTIEPWVVKTAVVWLVLAAISAVLWYLARRDEPRDDEDER